MFRYSISVLCHCLVYLASPCAHCGAQTFSTSELRSPGALTLRITSSMAQPMSIVSDALGGSRVFEVTGLGETWVRTSLSIGNGIGASVERLRIGGILEPLGRGAVIDLAGTSQATGLVIQGTGNTGSDNAAMMLMSASNGTGTGIRLGGPQASTRPTFSTGIEVTGGTGLRYNALNFANGTAFEIGATMPPNRGVDITCAGTDHIGILSRSNMGGAGIVGLCQSSSYTDPLLWQRVGVRGHAATNSNTSADSIVGVVGSVQRGGNGGTLTRSIGVYALAESNGIAHSGFVAGIVATARSASPGHHVAVAGVFNVHPDNGIAITAYGGDVVLGGSEQERPPLMESLPADLRLPTRNTVWTNNVRVGGQLDVRSVLMYQSQTMNNMPAGMMNVLVLERPVIRLDAAVAGTILPGIQARGPGDCVILIVTNGQLTLANESLLVAQETRFLLVNGVDLVLQENGSVTLWYDVNDARWRVIAVTP